MSSAMRFLDDIPTTPFKRMDDAVVGFLNATFAGKCTDEYGYLNCVSSNVLAMYFYKGVIDPVPYTLMAWQQEGDSISDIYSLAFADYPESAYVAKAKELLNAVFEGAL